MIGRRLSLWGPFVLVLAVGFGLSSMSSVPGEDYVWDKLLHATEFTGIGFFALRAFHGGLMPPRPKPTVVAGIVVVLWAISDEFHQSFVPGRDASARDVVADTVGFGIAVIVFRAIALIVGPRQPL